MEDDINVIPFHLYIHFYFFILPSEITHQHITIEDLILVQHQYNNCTTTPHMRVGPT
jgi:hypothetical protein